MYHVFRYLCRLSVWGCGDRVLSLKLTYYSLLSSTDWRFSCIFRLDVVCVLYIYISLKTEVEKMWVHLHSEALPSFALKFKGSFIWTKPYYHKGSYSQVPLLQCRYVLRLSVQSVVLAPQQGLAAWSIEDRLISSVPGAMQAGSLPAQIYTPPGNYWQHLWITS